MFHRLFHRTHQPVEFQDLSSSPEKSIESLVQQGTVKISILLRQIHQNQIYLLRHHPDDIAAMTLLQTHHDRLIRLASRVEHLEQEIQELSLSMAQTTSDTQIKMENFQLVLIERLRYLVEESLTNFPSPTEISDEITYESRSSQLSVTQTNRRRFLACGLSLTYFKDHHPIKRVFRDVIKFQSLIACDKYPYTFIISHFHENLTYLEAMIPIIIHTPDDPILESTEIMALIDTFLQEEDIYLAYHHMHQTICHLTRHENPGIEETIFIYQQIAACGLNDADFVYRLLTTCEGLDPLEQSRFNTISYMKTTILAFMDEFVD